jgi:hypothetical protein
MASSMAVHPEAFGAAAQDLTGIAHLVCSVSSWWAQLSSASNAVPRIIWRAHVVFSVA